MADARRFGLDEVVAYFQEFEDPRSEVDRKHPLDEVVAIALIAVLAGASGRTVIAQWAALKRELLASVLPLPHGVPRKDVFYRVLMALRPEAFRACFAAWVRSLRDEAAAEAGVERPTLAVDGKTLRRSHDRKNGLGALHAVSVWASEYGLSLGQVACAEKSNEMTAIPELLRLVDVSGGVMTTDAMGCQREIAGAVVAAKGDFVLALKENQGAPHQAVVDHLISRWEPDFAGDAVGRRQVEETGHGRREARTYIQLVAPQDMPGFETWHGLRSIGVAISEVVRDGKTADEVRYSISSPSPRPGRLLLPPSPRRRLPRRRPHLEGRPPEPGMVVYLVPLEIMHGNTTCLHVIHFGGRTFSDSVYFQARKRLPLGRLGHLLRSRRARRCNLSRLPHPAGRVLELLSSCHAYCRGTTRRRRRSADATASRRATAMHRLCYQHGL